MIKHIRYITGILIIVFSCKVNAMENRWELGIGTTAFNLPLYPGSADDKSFIIPFPFFRIQTEYFEVNEGVRSFFFETPDIRLNISADLGVPVSSDDSATREGMPDLNTVIQIGPSLEFIFSGGRRQPHEFRFELPLRSAIATDIKSSENIGWVLEPRITYETLRPFKIGFAYQLTAGLQYSSKEYHAYYYDVAESLSTSQRSAYTSDKGYSGFFTDLVINWREDDLIYFAFTRYKNLHNSSYEDSPLVEDMSYFSIGFGIAWVFASN